MADFSADVIRYLRRKSDGEFTEPVTYLGAEQRFVGALRNGGVNNLEEQYIIGVNTYTERYTDAEGNRITETSFYETEMTDVDGDFYFDEQKLVLPYNTDLVLFGRDTLIDFEGKQVTMPSDKATYNGEAIQGEDAEVFSFAAKQLRLDRGKFANKNALYGLDKLVFMREDEELIIHPENVNGAKVRSGYYKLVTIEYKEGIARDGFGFDGVAMTLPNDKSRVLYGDGSAGFPNTEGLYCLDTATFTLDVEKQRLKVRPTNYTIIKVDKLYYIKAGHADKLIITKTTGKKYLDNGMREVIKESVTNHLNPHA